MRRTSFAWWIFLLALLLRLVPVLVTRSLGIGLDDMFQYDMLARSLANGNGFRWYALQDLRMLQPYVDFDLTQVAYDPVRGVPTSFRAPLYPAFLAAVYLVAGTGPGRFFAARLAQALLGALLAPLTYHVARRLIPGWAQAAKLSAWIVAGYPMLLLYPIGLATENLFFPLALASFLVLLKTAEAPSWRNFALSGFLLALTALTRSVIALFAIAAVLWAWGVLKERRGALLMALVMLVVVSPWVVRNSLLHHRLSGIEASLGYNLYLGYHPQGDGSFVFGPSLDLLSVLDDAERNRLGTARALAFIRADPGRVLPLALNRLGFFMGLEKRVLMYFYSNNLLGYLPTPALLALAAVMLLPFVLVAPAAVAGLGTLRSEPGELLLLLLLAAYTLPHVLILAEDRFHLALVPYLAVLAAYVWTGGWRDLVARWRESLSGRAVVGLALAAACLLFLNWGLELAWDADKIAALLGPNGNQTFFPY